MREGRPAEEPQAIGFRGLGFRVTYLFKSQRVVGPRYCYRGYLLSQVVINTDSQYRNHTFYYKGALDPLGVSMFECM